MKLFPSARINVNLLHPINLCTIVPTEAYIAEFDNNMYTVVGEEEACQCVIM